MRYRAGPTSPSHACGVGPSLSPCRAEREAVPQLPLRPWGGEGRGEVGRRRCTRPSRSSSSPPPPAPVSRCCSCSGSACRSGCCRQIRWFGFAGLAVAFVLAAGGLVSSVFHLGRPERAWRAFSQWRSSWLSREGVLSVATFVPAAIFGDRLGLLRRHRPALSACAASLAAALAAGTIYCTGMIYASLKPIHQWRNRWTVPNYFALGLMAGFLLLDLLDPLLGRLAGRHPAPDLAGDRRGLDRSRKPIGA